MSTFILFPSESVACERTRALKQRRFEQETNPPAMWGAKGSCPGCSHHAVIAP